MSVDAKSKSTRIERHAGAIAVEAFSDVGDALTKAAVTMTDGGPLMVDAFGVRRTTSHAPPGGEPSAPVGTDAESRWKSALARLESGDRAGAETAFRARAGDRSADAHLRSRARFRAAQVALGRGDRGIARIELTPLVDDLDPSLASDAALLLARTLDTPDERRAMWDRLLARDLPEPYRSHAQSVRDAE